MNAGKKDGPAAPYPGVYSHEYPVWLLGGPVHDALVHIAAMKHETVRTRECLEDIEIQSRRQTQLLEFIFNENIIRNGSVMQPSLPPRRSKSET